MQEAVLNPSAVNLLFAMAAQPFSPAPTPNGALTTHVQVLISGTGTRTSRAYLAPHPRERRRGPGPPDTLARCASPAEPPRTARPPHASPRRSRATTAAVSESVSSSSRSRRPAPRRAVGPCGCAAPASDSDSESGRGGAGGRGAMRASGERKEGDEGGGKGGRES